MRNIWIHGWASDSRIWSPLPLGRQDHCVTLSDGATDFAQYCQHYWKALHITKPVTVIAWSFGTLIALQWLKQYPQWVQRVVAINGTPCFATQQGWPGITTATLTNLQHRLHTNAATTVKAFWWMLAQQESQPRQCLVRLQQYHINRDWLEQSLRWMIALDLRAIAQRYAQRCYWLMGRHDPLLPTNLYQHLPGAVQVLETGHCPMISQPEQLWQTLEVML